MSSVYAMGCSSTMQSNNTSLDNAGALFRRGSMQARKFASKLGSASSNWRSQAPPSTSAQSSTYAPRPKCGLAGENIVPGQVVHLPPFDDVAADSVAKEHDQHAPKYDHPFLVLRVLASGLLEGAILTSFHDTPITSRTFDADKQMRSKYFFVQHPLNKERVDMGKYYNPDNAPLYLRADATDLRKPCYVNMVKLLQIEPANLTYQRINGKDVKDIMLDSLSLERLLAFDALSPSSGYLPFRSRASSAPSSTAAFSTVSSSYVDIADIAKLSKRKSSTSTSSSDNDLEQLRSQTSQISLESSASVDTTITVPSPSPSPLAWRKNASPLKRCSPPSASFFRNCNHSRELARPSTAP